MATRLSREFQSRLKLDGDEYEVLSSGHRTEKAALRKGRAVLREIAMTPADQKGMSERLIAVPVPDLSAFPKPPPDLNNVDAATAWWTDTAGPLSAVAT